MKTPTLKMLSLSLMFMELLQTAAEFWRDNILFPLHGLLTWACLQDIIFVVVVVFCFGLILKNYDAEPTILETKEEEDMAVACLFCPESDNPPSSHHAEATSMWQGLSFNFSFSPLSLDLICSSIS